MIQEIGRNRTKRTALLHMVMAICLIIVLRVFTSKNFKWVSIVLSINFAYLLSKLVLSFFYKKCKTKTKRYRISVVIPSYNESEDSVLKAIHTLLQQNYPIYEILFIDDGSASDAAYQAVKAIDVSEAAGIHPLNRQTELIPIRLKKNVGKKRAQEVGFRRAQGELFLLVDSDGEISETAVAEMVKPFASKRVGSVVGMIVVRNKEQSFWTRMQDMIYHNSFEIGRAAQSITGCVVVCSGALSMHRARLVKRSLRTFNRDRFLGVPCSAGDDRLLTDISLERNYRTVYQNSAICYTDVPLTFRQFFKQQVRWTKSALLMSLFSLRYFYIRPLAIVWQLFETYLWLINLSFFIIVMAFREGPQNWAQLLVALLYFCCISYLTNAYYLSQKKSFFWQTLIYAIVYSFCLLSVRIYALLTIFRTGWATR